MRPGKKEDDDDDEDEEEEQEEDEEKRVIFEYKDIIYSYIETIIRCAVLL